MPDDISSPCASRLGHETQYLGTSGFLRTIAERAPDRREWQVVRKIYRHIPGPAGADWVAKRAAFVAAIKAQALAAGNGDVPIAPIKVHAPDLTPDHPNEPACYERAYYSRSLIEVCRLTLRHEDLLHIVREICRGLQALNQRCQRSHGDLKLENVLIGGSDETRDYAKDSVLITDLLECPPEQPVRDELKDLEHLGCIIYQLVRQEKAPLRRDIPRQAVRFSARPGGLHAETAVNWARICSRLLTRGDDPAGPYTVEGLEEELRKEQARLAKRSWREWWAIISSTLLRPCKKIWSAVSKLAARVRWRPRGPKPVHPPRSDGKPALLARVWAWGGERASSFRGHLVSGLRAIGRTLALIRLALWRWLARSGRWFGKQVHRTWARVCAIVRATFSWLFRTVAKAATALGPAITKVWRIATSPKFMLRAGAATGVLAAGGAMAWYFTRPVSPIIRDARIEGAWRDSNGVWFAKSGVNIRLTGTVRSRPRPKLTWMQADRPLNTNDEGECVVSNVLRQTTGVFYSVVAENRIYTNARSFPVGMLKVLEPPTIKKITVTNQSPTYDGDSVICALEMSGDPPFEIEWRYGTISNIFGSDSNRAEFSITASVAKECLVRVKNPVGEVNGSTAILFLADMRPGFSKSNLASRVVVGANETANLYAIATGAPPPQVTWRTNSSMTEPPAATGTSWQFSASSMTYTGTVWVTAKNRAGTSEMSFSLERPRPLIVTPNPLPDKVYEGENVTLRVNVTGEPGLITKWEKVPASNPKIQENDKGTDYLLKNVAKSDEGFYRATVWDAYGNKNSTDIHLTVRGREHRLVSETNPLVLFPGNKSSVSIEPFDTNHFNYSWSRDNGPEQPLINGILPLNGENSDLGKPYQIMFQVRQSQTTWSNVLKLTVNVIESGCWIMNQPQRITRELKKQAIFSVVLDTQKGAQGTNFVWSHLGKAIPGATNATYSFIITNDTQEGDYQVHFQSVYGIPTNSDKAQLTVQIPPPKIRSLQWTNGTPLIRLFIGRATNLDFNVDAEGAEVSVSPRWADPKSSKLSSQVFSNSLPEKLAKFSSGPYRLTLTPIGAVEQKFTLKVEARNNRGGDSSAQIEFKVVEEMTNSLGMVMVRVDNLDTNWPGPTPCWVGRYEVTVAEYLKLGLTPNSGFATADGSNSWPVFVTSEQATNFCSKLNQAEQKQHPILTNKEYALLTFDQWKLLAEQDMDDPSLWKGPKIQEQPSPVGAYGTNKFGLCDLNGNAREIVEKPAGGYLWAGAYFKDAVNGGGGTDPGHRGDENRENKPFINGTGFRVVLR